MTLPRKDPLDKATPEPSRLPSRGVVPQKLKENATDADSLKGKPISTNPPGVGHALIYDGEEYVPQPVHSGSGSGVTIEDEGTTQGDATIINFTGAGVSATVAAGEATVTISGGGGGGHTIRENGVDQTARTGLNFIDADAGAGLITDDAGGNETEVNLSLYVLEAQHGGVSPTGHHAQSHDHSAAGDGTALVPASLNDTGIFQLSGDAEESWSAQKDNYDPGTNTVINVLLPAGNQTLTGVTGGSDGRILIIHNRDASDTLTIADNSAGSTAANRFELPSDMSIASMEGAVFVYHATVSRWKCFGRYSASAGGGVHGPSSHTEGTAWRMTYQDVNGDETEFALGADATFLESNGTTSAPAFRALVGTDIPAATETARGTVELATAPEITAGGLLYCMTPARFKASDPGTRVVGILVSDPLGAAITTGDGKAYFRVPSVMNTWDLVSVAGHYSTFGTTTATLVQLRKNRRTAAGTRSDTDMLSTRLMIDASEYDSEDATTAYVIDTLADQVITGDVIFIDVDQVGTGGKGLFVEMQFRLP